MNLLLFITHKSKFIHHNEKNIFSVGDFLPTSWQVAMAILRHMESMNMKPTNTKKDTTTITKGMTMNMRDMIMNMKRPEKDMPVKFRLKKHWRKQSDCRRLRLSRVFLPM